jgi:hypothetical protein
MSESDLSKSLEQAIAEIETLKTRIDSFERSMNLRRTLPNTSLLSDKFLQRAFAVLGHNFVASLLISIPFYVIIFLFALMAR